MSKKRGKSRAQRMNALEMKQRSSLIQMIAAFGICIVMIVLKLNLTYAGFEWANTTVANGVVFVGALVLAGVAGIGSRNWTRARKELRALRQQGK